MAEVVIGSIAEKIVAILGSQAIETVGKLWGVKHELKALEATVSALLAVLHHAEEQYYQSSQVHDYVDKLKDALYDAQDVLEEFNIEAMRRELRGSNEMTKEVRTFFSSSNQLAFKLKMSYKVRAARESIEAVKADKGFHLDEHSVDSEVVRERRERKDTHSFIPKGYLIGRDADKNTVRKFLMDSDVKEPISILPIVGIGGLGKTALAQFVYNDEMVSNQFELKMWVCVSDDFDVKKIVKSIIACAKNEKPTEDEMEQLQRKLRAKINEKRYLLVLDDVWNEEQETWLRLKNLLVGGARGSKILITTRLHSVAKITGTALPHLLVGLSESESLDLLMQMASRKEEDIQDPEMLAIATEIARKCSGVPLVVRTIGGLLFHEESKHKWSQFKDKELPEVFQSEGSIKSVLKLSYNHLPSHLKQCFAFCSLFPKDYEMKTQTLVDLWVAEGFIRSSNKRQPLEDIGHKYFMDLLWSNFFQEFKKDPYTMEETCKMHDLMHDLACLVAGNECWVADGTKSIHERTRHISHGLTSNLIDELPISCLKASAPRTFLSTAVIPLFWTFRGEPVSEAYICELIQSFKRFRILDLHATNVEKVPRSICKLKHLTYLDLSYNKTLKRLPDSITRLQNLQTLNLNSCSTLEELPKGIRKLVGLRNLDINCCFKLSYVPRGLGQLSSLHRLTRFILPKDKALTKDCCGLGELNGLNDIRGSLIIENLGSVTDAVAESKAANLIGKHSLESLELCWSEFYFTDDVVIGDRDEALVGGLQPHSNLQKLTISRYRGQSFPKWMTDNLAPFSPNLVEVSIDSCGSCKRLPPLGQLPCLKSLVISNLPKLEDIEPGHSSTSTSSFPSLLKLNIRGCEKLKAMPQTPHLEELRVTKALPAMLINMIFGLNKLKLLEMDGMESLECLPEECLKSLTSLESLHIVGCHELTSLSPQHLSNLVNLSIKYCKELDISEDESIGNNSILDFHGGLQNLRSVELTGLLKLSSLPQWLLQASNLESLTLERCWKLNLCKDESGNNNNLILDSHGGLHHSLRSLRISGLPKLASLPRWLPQASNLECLIIFDCFNLKELPMQIEALQSLQELRIFNCPSLTSLPEGMRRLASLTHLIIIDCPELKRRYKRDGGEDWDKIAHIPDLYI